MKKIHKYNNSDAKYTSNIFHFMNVVLPGDLRISNDYICTHLLAEILQDVSIFDNRIHSHKHNPKDILDQMQDSPYYNDKPLLIKNIYYACIKYNITKVDNNILKSII